MALRTHALALSFSFALLLALKADAQSSRGWALFTQTPTPASSPDPRDASLLSLCGPGESTLHLAASQLAQRGLQTASPPNMVQLSQQMRMLGEPHTDTRAWTFASPKLDRLQAQSRLQDWLSTLPHQGIRRCGIANVQDSERGEVLAVVVQDVLADLLQPLALQIRPSSWVSLQGQMRVPCSGAKVIVLGPRGSPRTIPTSFDPSTGQVVARFMADQPGRWLVQLLATTSTGPRPVLETVMFAGPVPMQSEDETQAPGEQVVQPGISPSQAIEQMLNAARASEHLPPLAPDAQLSALAVKHSQAMMRAALVGHDVGDGTPSARVSQAGLSVHELGENVAHARLPQLAHRALWASPSHRTNMLHTRFTRVGIGVVRDEQGTLWVTQLFADGQGT